MKKRRVDSWVLPRETPEQEAIRYYAAPATSGVNDASFIEECDVPIATLHGTQGFVLSDKVIRYVARGPQRDGNLPTVFRYNGVDSLLDGHHRAEAARRRGEITIRAVVRDFSRVIPWVSRDKA